MLLRVVSMLAYSTKETSLFLESGGTLGAMHQKHRPSAKKYHAISSPGKLGEGNAEKFKAQGCGGGCVSANSSFLWEDVSMKDVKRKDTVGGRRCCCGRTRPQKQHLSTRSRICNSVGGGLVMTGNPRRA